MVGFRRDVASHRSGGSELPQPLFGFSRGQTEADSKTPAIRSCKSAGQGRLGKEEAIHGGESRWTPGGWVPRPSSAFATRPGWTGRECVGFRRLETPKPFRGIRSLAARDDRREGECGRSVTRLPMEGPWLCVPTSQWVCPSRATFEAAKHTPESPRGKLAAASAFQVAPLAIDTSNEILCSDWPKGRAAFEPPTLESARNASHR